MAYKLKRAFTIIELLVVIVVIVILATVIIISYSNTSQRAAAASLQSDLANAAKKIQIDFSTNGTYPTALANVDGGNGVKTSPGTSYAYQYDNTLANPSYCLTAYNGSKIYYVSSSSNVSVGGCTTGGVATSGLVLNYDAGNTVSYPTSGTNWYDLSSSASHGVLTNGPTYTATNSGIINFDGVDDYMDFYAPGLGTTTTVEMWAKIGSTGGKMMFGWNLYDIYVTAGSLGYNTASSDVYGLNSATVTSLGLVGNWVHYIFEMRSDVSYTNNKIYINGVSQSLSQALLGNGESSASRNFNNGNGRISMWRNSSGAYYMPQSVGLFRVYNRALTQSEITSNFNATKARYGL